MDKFAIKLPACIVNIKTGQTDDFTIRPCPFCNGPSKLYYHKYQYGPYIYCECTICGTQSKGAKGLTPNLNEDFFKKNKDLCTRIIKQWNHRASEHIENDKIDEPLKDIESKIDGLLNLTQNLCTFLFSLPENIGDYKITGIKKYAKSGKTLNEINDIDSTFLNWIAKNYKPTTLQGQQDLVAIKKYLSTLE
jgi:hypothetical protein